MAKTTKLSGYPAMRSTTELRYVRRSFTERVMGQIQHHTQLVLQQKWEPILGSCVEYEDVPQPEWRDVPIEEEFTITKNKDKS